MAAALAESQRLNIPQAGVYENDSHAINVVHLDRDKLERYLGTALRQLRHIRMQVNSDIADVIHPSGDRGCLLRGCPACSQGMDTDGLAVPDARARPSGSGDTHAPPEESTVVVRVVCINNDRVDPCSMKDSLGDSSK